MISPATRPIQRSAPAPLIAHIVHRLATGGLENGLVNLINRLPAERYRHAVICLTDYGPFRHRIERADVEVFGLGKRDGQDWALYSRLFRLLRRLRPAVVHTRNIATLECQVAALLAGVRRRMHGEHGWDVSDLFGGNRRYRWLRRALSPLVHRFVPLSRDLERYLTDAVGVPPGRITRICNGVDTALFRPGESPRSLPIPALLPADAFVVGTVGRMEPVKDPLNLARAFLRLRETLPAETSRLRLMMLGDGALKKEVTGLLSEHGAGEAAWLPGTRDDVPQLLPAMSVFALPSLAEGISNTILEAMASGLPVVATSVGGNPELVDDGVSGLLVPPSDPEAMARGLASYATDSVKLRRHGEAARRRAVADFSIDGMVDRYRAVYDALLDRGPVSEPLSALEVMGEHVRDSRYR